MAILKFRDWLRDGLQIVFAVLVKQKDMYKQRIAGGIPNIMESIILMIQ